MPVSSIQACWAISVARIFDWERGTKPQTTCNDVIRNFQKKKFLWDKDIAVWKMRSRGLCLAHNQDFAKRRELKPKKKCKLGDVLSKLV